MSNQLVYDVTDADFEARVVQRSYQVPVVIDFWADWCAPCHALGPMLERGVEARGGAVELARIDVDQSPQLAAAFGVQGIPAVKAVKEGRLVDEFVGAQPQNVVEQFLDGLLPSQADVAAAEAATLDPTRAEARYREILADDQDNAPAWRWRPPIPARTSARPPAARSTARPRRPSPSCWRRSARDRGSAATGRASSCSTCSACSATTTLWPAATART